MIYRWLLAGQRLNNLADFLSYDFIQGEDMKSLPNSVHTFFSHCWTRVTWLWHSKIDTKWLTSDHSTPLMSSRRALQGGMLATYSPYFPYCSSSSFHQSLPSNLPLAQSPSLSPSSYPLVLSPPPPTSLVFPLSLHCEKVSYLLILSPRLS